MGSEFCDRSSSPDRRLRSRSRSRSPVGRGGGGGSGGEVGLGGGPAATAKPGLADRLTAWRALAEARRGSVGLAVGGGRTAVGGAATTEADGAATLTHVVADCGGAVGTDPGSVSGVLPVRHRATWAPSFVPGAPAASASDALAMASAAAAGVAAAAVAAAGAAPQPAAPDDDDGSPDELDAFMAEAVLPEVRERERVEAEAAAEARAALARRLAAGGRVPLLAELEKDDEDETPDTTVEVDAKRIKFVIGRGGRGDGGWDGAGMGHYSAC